MNYTSISSGTEVIGQWGGNLFDLGFRMFDFGFYFLGLHRLIFDYTDFDR